MGHYDDDALAAALTLPDADVALVASVRRSAAVFDTLRARGVSDEQLARVRAPAGVRRAGAQEEIALHALAEVVALRHDRLTANPVPDPALLVGFAIDPVCGMTVDTADAAHTAVHDGTTYYFCCAGCREQFVARPGPVCERTRRLSDHLERGGGDPRGRRVAADGGTEAAAARRRQAAARSRGRRGVRRASR